MAIGLIIYAIIDLLIIIPFVHKVIPTINYWVEVKALAPSFFLTLFMSLVIIVFLSVISNIYLQLFGGFIIGVFVYLLMAYIMKIPELQYYLRKIHR